MTTKTCLLIAPLSFYSYSQYVKEALAASGYEVTVSNDEYPQNTLGKIMGKLRIPLLLKITRKTIKSKYLNVKVYDLILIVKGRGMSPELIGEFKKLSPNVIGYSFDSFKYHSAPLKWFKVLDRFYTFDYYDSEKYNIPVVELFSSLPVTDKQKSVVYDISAIVRNHSDRLRYIDEVLKNLPTGNQFIYIYEQNLFSFLQNFLRNPFLYLKFRKHIWFKPLPFSKYFEVLQGSGFTIDFAHPKQTGITIRSFEALSTQTKIITNNPFVSKYHFFNDDNSILFRSTDDAGTLKKRYKRTEKTIPQKHNRTVHDFVSQLISPEHLNSGVALAEERNMSFTMSND